MRRAFILLPLGITLLGFLVTCSNSSDTESSSSSKGGSSTSSTSATTKTTTTSPSTTTSVSSPSNTSLDSATISTGTGFDGGIGQYCKLPGSRQYLPGGQVNVVPGGSMSEPDLSWITLPPGYCVHWFGNVGNARQMRFAPGGELFVASPTAGTTGGNSSQGQSSIILLPDDDADGYADQNIVFLNQDDLGQPLASTQGLMFANDKFYFQAADKESGMMGTRILEMPYAKGDRKPNGAISELVDITYYYSTTHWPKTIDIATDGTIYVGQGGDQSETCDPTRPFHGGIVKVDGTPGGNPIVKGLRNPISIRCQKDHNACYAVELALDYSAGGGGREKLLPIHEGDDWGFPCCATQGVPYPGISPTPDCSKTAAETGAFIIGETPFAFDFETGKWPAPYTKSVFIPLHGVAGSWQGARVVAIATDPTTGAPLPGSDLNGQATGSLSDFAVGWDDGSHSHGRPATIVFATDGRMFLGNDNDGNIVWIAPLGMN